MAFQGVRRRAQGDLQEQVYRFIDAVLREGDGKVETLLTAGFTFMKGGLYDLYGLPRPAGAAADSWTRVELPAKERAGLLTHAGMLAGMAHEDRTSYILRGKLVREALLCTVVPPPPAGVDASEMNIPATATAQERSVLHRTKPECASCHELFDSAGLRLRDFRRRRPLPEQRRRGQGDRLQVGHQQHHRAGRHRGRRGRADPTARARRRGAGLRGAAVAALRPGSRARRERRRLDADRGPQEHQRHGGKMSDILGAVARSNAFRHLKVKP